MTERDGILMTMANIIMAKHRKQSAHNKDWALLAAEMIFLVFYDCVPMKGMIAKNGGWSLEDYFQRLRWDKNHSLPNGYIKLSQEEQDDICLKTREFYKIENTNTMMDNKRFNWLKTAFLSSAIRTQENVLEHKNACMEAVNWLNTFITHAEIGADGEAMSINFSKGMLDGVPFAIQSHNFNFPVAQIVIAPFDGVTDIGSGPGMPFTLDFTKQNGY